MVSTADAPSPAKVQAESSGDAVIPKAKDRYNTPIPKEINYIWLGRTFEDFDQIPIQECVKTNPDYRIRLWLDDFSMLEMEGPCGLPRILPSASLRIYTSGMNEAISSADINKTFAMLVRAQLEYYKVNLTSQFRTQLPTIQKFRDFLQHKQLHSVDLVFLSDFYAALFDAEHQRNGNSLCYPSLRPSSTATAWNTSGPEVQLLQWVFFERYRGNYTAASNLLRAQLLQTYPGVYVDHRTLVPPLGNMTGFRFALTATNTATQTFLASCPGHPFLQYFRYSVLQKYDKLLKRKFRCVMQDYTTMRRPVGDADSQNPFVMETWGLSGAGAFFGALRDVVEGGLGEEVDVGGGAMMVGVNERGR